MKKLRYTMTTISSLIVSPRSGQGLYKEIDQYCLSPFIEKQEVKLIYPFYQYGEYNKYDPEHTDYYLPGSSIKGALQHQNKDNISFMVDDVQVPNSAIVLRNLWKAQYLEEVKHAKFATFFEHVGVEMIKAGTELKGELYLEDNEQFLNILTYGNEGTVKKIGQMRKYLQMLLNKDYQDEDLKNKIQVIEDGLYDLQGEKNLILLGGYKGLLHSILLSQNYKSTELTGGLFIDLETSLPHGFVKLKLISEM